MNWRMRYGRNWGHLGMKYNVNIKKLSEVADLTVGFVGSMAKHYVDEGVPFLRSTNIRRFKIDMSDIKYISPEFNEKIKKSQLREGDVVIVRTGMPGACTVILKEQEGWNCSDLVIIHPHKEKVLPLYIAAYVNYSTGIINANLVGAVQQHFNVGSAKNMEIAVPSIEIQKKIVGIIQNINEKLDINSRINKNLLQQAQALYKDRFVDLNPFDGEMPPDWRLGTVSEIIELHDSKRIPLSSRERANLAKIYPYYGATSVMDYVDRYLFDGIYLLLGEDGTVVDSKGFPILQYVEGKFWVNNHAHIITGKNGFTVETLYLLFSLTNVQSIVTGAVQPKISQANLNKVSVVIPSEAELSAFNSIVQPIFAQIRNLRAENDRLAATRDTLLPRLMSGELDVSSIDL